MIHISSILKHYTRKDIQEEILANSKDREVSVRYPDGSFGKRPDVLHYPDDVMASVQQFADQRRYVSSFHASEERWANPLLLRPSMKKNELDDNRIGWDLVIDVDCHFPDYSKIAADLIIKFLKFSGIKTVSVKFSGRAGFHIGVPWECFPKSVGGKDIKNMFPEAPKKIALYIKERIKEGLSENILKFENNDFARIKEKTGLTEQEITRELVDKGLRIKKLNVEPFLDIDTILISSRHLYRMPYAFNEKSGLVSVPVESDKVLQFDLNEADFKNVVVKPNLRFLDATNAVEGEARKLLIEALDFKAKEEIKTAEQKAMEEVNVEFEVLEEAIPEICFPPCMHNIFKGMKDGRKRAMFILVNFLSSCGWGYDQMEQRMKDWNKQNEEPLPEQDIIGRIRYQKAKNQMILPPNCDNKAYYKDIGLCTPDGLCNRIKNPISYAKFKLKQLKFQEELNAKQEAKAAKKKQKEAQKETPNEQSKETKNE
jgi:hypothetical protein